MRRLLGRHLPQPIEKDGGMPRQVRHVLVRRPRAGRRPPRQHLRRRAGEDRVERVELGLQPEQGRALDQGVTPLDDRRVGAAGGACTAAGTVSVRLNGASAALTADAFVITAFRSAIALPVCAFTSVYARTV